MSEPNEIQARVEDALREAILQGDPNDPLWNEVLATFELIAREGKAAK